MIEIVSRIRNIKIVINHFIVIDIQRTTSHGPERGLERPKLVGRVYPNSPVVPVEALCPVPLSLANLPLRGRFAHHPKGLHQKCNYADFINFCLRLEQGSLPYPAIADICVVATLKPTSTIVSPGTNLHAGSTPTPV